MVFKLYLLIDTDGDNRYPYIAKADDSDWLLHICTEHIHLSREVDADNFYAQYLLTSRSIEFDIDRMIYICDMWKDENLYELTIHFQSVLHITLYKMVEGTYMYYDALGDDTSILARQLINHLYPLFQPVYDFIASE